METLPVVFRADRSGPFMGEVTAVFPTLPADYRGHEMVCYSHIGQHSGCSREWYRLTRPAKATEYADLLAGLRTIYERDEDEPVKLVLYQRIQPTHHRAFGRNLHRQNHPE